MDKKKIVSILTVMVVMLSIFAVAKPTYAANGWITNNSFFTKLIEFISQKFGLDKTQVQNAVTDFGNQQKATITPKPSQTPQQIQDREKKRLDPLVTQGKITTDQENAILTELTALRAKYPFDKNQTPDQRKTQIQNMQNDWKVWTQANSIDLTIIGPFGGGMMRGGGIGMRRGWDKNNDSDDRNKPTVSITPKSN